MHFVEAAAKADKSMSALDSWAPTTVAEALLLLAGLSGRNAHVRKYVMRSMSTATDEELSFWLPQTLQALRNDDGSLARCVHLQLLTFTRPLLATSVAVLAHSRHLDSVAVVCIQAFSFACLNSERAAACCRFLCNTAIQPERWMFLHKLIWALDTEQEPPAAEFDPEVKRSGWQPPRDTGLWEPCKSVKATVLSQLTAAARVYFDVEHGTFQKVTDISGKLKPVPKVQRRDVIAAEARLIAVPRQDLYLPVDPHKRLVSIIPESGAAMQSAAKTPILLAFMVEALPVEAHVVKPGAGRAHQAGVHLQGRRRLPSGRARAAGAVPTGRLRFASRPVQSAG